MFIDSHCHLDRLDLSPYHNDFSLMLNAADERRVKKMLCVSIDLAHFDEMYALIEAYEQVYASVGVHPLSAAEEQVSINDLVERAEREKLSR